MPNSTESSYIFSIAELIEFLDQYEQENSPCSKEAVAVAVKNRFVLSRNRSVYYNNHFAIRFSAASSVIAHYFVSVVLDKEGVTAVFTATEYSLIWRMLDFLGFPGLALYLILGKALRWGWLA